MRRVVSVFLPVLPTDRLRKVLKASAPQADRPFATAHHDGRRRIVAAVDQFARAEGLTPGMPLAHARMLVPELAVLDADPAADLAALHRLAVWAQQHYSPLAAPDPPDGIWLDVTGCTHLWGNEQALLVDLQARLERSGFQSRVALADTPGAAHAVARFGGAGSAIVAPSAALAATRGLPIQALRLPSEAVVGLRRLGFDTIGDLMRAPRPQLALRFGTGPGRRLDQLVGALFEPIDPVQQADAVVRRLPFVEPISTREAIGIAIDKLVDLICQDLINRGLGARGLDLLCERVDGGRQAIRVGMARPTREPAHLLKLLSQRVEHIEPGFGIDAMVAIVVLAEPLRPESVGNLVHRDPDIGDLAGLIDSLSNRLGDRKLFRAMPFESDVPERSWTAVPPLSPPGRVTWPDGLPRPSRLLTPPEPIETTALLPDHPPALFTWRQHRHRVSRVDGPERIHGEWWRADREIAAVRDYFAVEDEVGARFWVFRSGVDNLSTWFIHGIF